MTRGQLGPASIRRHELLARVRQVAGWSVVAVLFAASAFGFVFLLVWPS